MHTFFQQKGIHTFIINQKTPKNKWQDKLVCVNRDLVSYGYPHKTNFTYQISSLWRANEIVVNALKTTSFNREDREDNMLVVVGMSAVWRADGAMPQFFVKRDGWWLPPPLLRLVSFVCISLYI